MQFSLLYGQQLDIELASQDGGLVAGATNSLFTTARRKQAVNDAMHNFERVTSCTPVYGSISVTNKAASAVIAAGGTGYSVNDVLTVTGGTFTTAAQFTVTAVANGVVTTVSLTMAGAYTVEPASPVSVTGGTGTLATLTLTWTGTSEYDLLSNFPQYISLQDRREPTIKRVTSTGVIRYIQGDDFQRQDPTWLDREAPGWLADPKGTPTSWYVRDDSGTTYLGLHPPPDPAGFNETWTLNVPYLARSTDLSADTDIPFTVAGKSFAVLVPYHQALVHYAAGLLEPLRKNYSGAQRQMQLYAGYIAQFETKKRKDGPNQVTLRRSYFRDAGRFKRPVDPHRFP